MGARGNLKGRSHAALLQLRCLDRGRPGGAQVRYDWPLIDLRPVRPARRLCRNETARDADALQAVRRATWSWRRDLRCRGCRTRHLAARVHASAREFDRGSALIYFYAGRAGRAVTATPCTAAALERRRQASRLAADLRRQTGMHAECDRIELRPGEVQVKRAQITRRGHQNSLRHLLSKARNAERDVLRN